ncbi:MAG: hypothetical protein LBN23_00195, partial [Paludibacter sp.]|nr:hypothetical protein [Paludibacter sp.]
MKKLLFSIILFVCLMAANTAQAQSNFHRFYDCNGIAYATEQSAFNAGADTTKLLFVGQENFLSGMPVVIKGKVCGNLVINGDHSVIYNGVTIIPQSLPVLINEFDCLKEITVLEGSTFTLENFPSRYNVVGNHGKMVGNIKVLGTLNVNNSKLDGNATNSVNQYTYFQTVQIGDATHTGTANFTDTQIKRGGSNLAALYVQNGSLSLTDCVIDSLATGAAAVYTSNVPTNSVTINGGNIKGAASAVYSLGGTVTIDGGTYASATNNPVISIRGGVLNMSNTAVNSAASLAMHFINGTANVSGTTVTTTGNWAAIHNGGANVTLTNCTVNQTWQNNAQAAFYTDAGTSNINSSYISGYHAVDVAGGSVTLNGANLNATVGNALVIVNASANVSASNSTFTAHEGNPASPAAINFLASGNLVWGTGNSINDLVGIVALRFTTVSNNFVLPKIEIPYQMEQPITVNQGGSFTLTAGNTLRIDKTGTFNIRGNFSANGTSTNQIAINKTTAGNAFEVNDGGVLNLTYSNLNTLSGIKTNNGTTNLTNSTLAATAGNALIIGHENAEVFLVGTSVTASDKDIQYLAGGDIEFDAQSSLTGSNTVYTFEFSGLNSQMDLVLLPKPIVVPNNFTVNSGGIWNIAAGNSFQTGLIKISGTVNAPSSAGSQITFVSTAGMFNMLAGGTLNASNILVNAAGNAFAMNGGAAVVDNSVFNISAGDGIVFNGASSLTVTNSSFSLAAAYYPLTYASAGGSLFWGEGNSISGGKNHVQITFASLNAAMNLPHFPLPYVFKTGGDFTITPTGHLNIESNNIVKFANWFYVKGKLTAQAQNGESILFTSANDDNAGGDTNNGTPDIPAVGSWGGVWFEDATSDASVLSGCELRFGGKNSRGVVYVGNLASPTIENCRLSNSYYGFELRNGASPVLTGNNIASSAMVPVAMTLDCNPTMTTNEFSTSDNVYDAIGILPGTLAYDAHIIKRALLPSPNVTYLLLGTVENPAGKTLTIDAGVVIKAMNSSHYIKNNGTLKALGTASEKIVFTSVHDDNVGNPSDTKSDGNIGVPAAGDWSGIYFGNLDDTQSILDHCIVKYAQNNQMGNYNGGAITVENASPAIKNTTIQLTTYGIVASKAAKPLIENVTIENSSSTPVAMSITADPTFVNLTYNSVGYHAIGLLSESVGVSGTLKQRNIAGYNNITYVPLGNITITSGTTVTIEKGIVMKPLNAAIYINGALVAQGTASEKIIFTSINDDTYGSPLDTKGDASLTTPAKGDWYWLNFGATSDDNLCLLENCVVKYAGKWDGAYRAVIIESASPTIKNTLISSSYAYGLWLAGDAAPDLSENVTIEECGVSPIIMSFTCNPVMNLSSPVFAA